MAGTPLYLAPESITDPTTVDHRVDLYALGAVGYCLLTGAPPFQGRTTVEICGQHSHAVPAPPSARAKAPLPAPLGASILRCLAKRREGRPASARELQELSRECAALAPWTDTDAAPFWETWSATRARLEESLPQTAVTSPLS